MTRAGNTSTECVPTAVESAYPIDTGALSLSHSQCHDVQSKQLSTNRLKKRVQKTTGIHGYSLSLTKPEASIYNTADEHIGDKPSREKQAPHNAAHTRALKCTSGSRMSSKGSVHL